MQYERAVDFVHERDYDLRRKIFAVTQSVTNAPVNPDFKVISSRHIHTSPMEEFVSDTLGGRFIAMASNGDIARKHAVLAEEGLPVFSCIYTHEGLLLLHVPTGARPVANYQHSMRRNPSAFFEAFEEIGATLSELARKDHGTLQPTEDYPILKQFALAADSGEPSGGGIYLLPPYNIENLGDGINRDGVLSFITHELLDTQIVLPEHTTQLVDRISNNWVETEDA